MHLSPSVQVKSICVLSPKNMYVRMWLSQYLHHCEAAYNAIIDFPNLGSTYNGGWCLATETDEILIPRPSCEVNVK